MQPGNYEAMRVLSIDTSCDETAAAVTVGNRILSNVIWSQASLHAKWGGVVPSLAQRAHQERLPWVVARALRLARVDAIAVTIGPGLAPALEVGIRYAKQLALLHKIALIPVNHLEGHIVSSLAQPNSPNSANSPDLPNSLALIISGGHTELIEITFSQSSKIPNYHVLARTLDDALGEALDKAARMLGLGYPGGAVLEKFAKQGDPRKYELPRPLLGRENQGHFSFSGLKTAFYRLVEGRGLNQQETGDLAASFQNTAFEHLIRVVSRSIEKAQLRRPPKLGLKTINLLVGGGVAANIELRKKLRKLSKEFGLKIHFPYSKKLCTDNAAMIGLAARYAFARGEAAETKKEISALDRRPNLAL